MKTICYILFLASLLLTACNDENEEKEFVMSAPPIGETFESLSSSITFESADSVSFYFLHEPQIPGGKAKYHFNNGKVIIENPYGEFLPYEKVTDTYFVFFEGGFTSNDKLEAEYELVAVHGAIDAGGTNIWWRIKHPKQ